MPGPGRKKQPKPKTRPANSVSKLSSFTHEIDNTEGWGPLIDLMCRAYDLPDMNSRSGLKKIHANFQDIFRKLDAEFQLAQRNNQEKIMGAIVGIWAKMSVDGILRDKLFHAGFIPKMLPLLNIPSTRLATLQAFSTITHHGGLDVHKDIARNSSSFLLLLQQIPDDVKIHELVIIILSHCVGHAVTENPLDLAVMRKIDLTALLKQLLDSIQKPNATRLLMTHGISFLQYATENCAKQIRANPSSIALLVASLRSQDITIRCGGLVALLRLHVNDSEDEQRFFDPNRMMAAAQRGFPPNLMNTLADNLASPMDSETFVNLKTSRDYQHAMMQCAQDHDLYSLGKKLAQIITVTEFSISQGGFQAQNERTGRMELMDVGLPFKMWTDSLPHCARALRAKGSPTDLDMADICELKSQIMTPRGTGNAVMQAKASIIRNPDVAYFYYVVGLSANRADALRAAKQGIKAKQITPYIRFSLLWRAIESAADMGVGKVADSPAAGQDFSEGIAFLISAFDDATTYVQSAPPDARYFRAILNWYILLTLAIQGPELSVDLKELEPTMKKMETAVEFANFLGYDIRKTQIHMTRELALKHYSSASQEWGPLIARLDSLHSSVEREKTSVENAEDQLAVWLENLEIDDGDDHKHDHGHCRGHRRNINRSTVELYSCSWCKNPSAVLKKCSGCQKTRYCDSSCQKNHWSAHRAACKAATSA